MIGLEMKWNGTEYICEDMEKYCWETSRYGKAVWGLAREKNCEERIWKGTGGSERIWNCIEGNRNGIALT